MVRRLRIALLLALPCTLALTACGGGGGSGSSQNFVTCGNGHLDTGEVCDDGNLDDHDACTTACRPARCGDGVAEATVEDCDSPELASCAPLGRGGNASCDAACHADFAACGALFTPTPTAAPPTPTPTATPSSMCGDGLLSADETCTRCALDCSLQPCASGGDTVAVNVRLSLPSGASVSPITLSLAYRTSIVSLPDTGLLSRFARAPGVVVQPTDNDYAVDVRAGRSGGGLTTGPLFTVTFDRCAGAAAPRGMDFACTVTNCGTISDCICVAEVP